MGRTVCLNVNVLLRTFIKTMGMISLMMNLSWKLTFLVLMETPITGLIQNIYDTHYQVTAGRDELLPNKKRTVDIKLGKSKLLNMDYFVHCYIRGFCSMIISITMNKMSGGTELSVN